MVSACGDVALNPATLPQRPDGYLTADPAEMDAVWTPHSTSLPDITML